VVKIFIFLELEPRLNVNADLTGQAKMNIFQRSLKHKENVLYAFLSG
jgi:hypothetical protein